MMWLDFSYVFWIIRYSIKNFPIQIYGNSIIIFDYLKIRLTYMYFNEYIDVSQRADSHRFFGTQKKSFLNGLDHFNWILEGDQNYLMCGCGYYTIDTSLSITGASRIIITTSLSIILVLIYTSYFNYIRHVIFLIFNVNLW